MSREREIERALRALDDEKAGLVFAWIEANGHGPRGDGSWPYAEGEKATAGRKREITEAQRALREERKALKAAARSARESRAAERKRERTAARDAVTEECQICERRQCVDSRGNMVHHGYQRPGWGEIVGDCYGVGRKPYPATDALAEWLQIVTGDAKSCRAQLAGLGERERIIRMPRYKGDRMHTFDKAETHPQVWARELESLKWDLEARLRHAEGDIVRITARIENAERRQG